jgi:hypothetical protein
MTHQTMSTMSFYRTRTHDIQLEYAVFCFDFVIGLEDQPIPIQSTLNNQSALQTSKSNNQNTNQNRTNEPLNRYKQLGNPSLQTYQNCGTRNRRAKERTNMVPIRGSVSAPTSAVTLRNSQEPRSSSPLVDTTSLQNIHDVG